MTTQITVVVCTRNRADRLPAAVGSLAGLRTDGRFKYDVLVIDNGSTDHTAAVVERMATTFPVPLRRVFEERPGVGRARNRGVEEARGDWVAFFDDDQLADLRWLSELYDLAERHGAECVGGKVRLCLPEGVERPLAPFCRVLLGGSVGMETERPYTLAATPGAGNLMIRRPLFARLGGFDETLIRGEDTDLFLRMHAAGIPAWYSPTAAIDHLIPPERLSDEFLLRVATRMGEGMAAKERNARGPVLYPLIWLARVGQAAGVLGPRLIAARLRGDREAALGAHCRWVIAQRVLREGLTLIASSAARPGSPRPSKPPATLSGTVRSMS